MNSKTLDRLDLKILDVLQQNARITNQALAERVALSPSACLARVRALEAQGLIGGYRAQVAIDRIRSATIVLMLVSFRSHAMDDFRDFDQCILDMPQIVEACRISGGFDYLLRAIVTDMHEWKTIAKHLLNGDYGVEKIVSHILIDEIKPFCGYPLTPAARR
ncbi:MAG: Lrp/AsnC family transcriptional regulator [Pseudoxanthomonas sp.]